jgi:glycosyltransferase involved in cell wall biosynthesis
MARVLKEKNEIDFIFNIVGEGIELPRLKELVQELGLENRVIFQGLRVEKTWIRYIIIRCCNRYYRSFMVRFRSEIRSKDKRGLS